MGKSRWHIGLPLAVAATMMGTLAAPAGAVAFHRPALAAHAPRPARGKPGRIGAGGIPAPMRALEAALAPAAKAAGMGQLPAGLTASNWRSRLHGLLARLTAGKPGVTVSGSARGVLLAGTVHLPSHLTLTGDTTIVAQQITLASR